MDKTKCFTVELDQNTYEKLLQESKKREGETRPVPSRTARQLLEEALTTRENKNRFENPF